MRQEVHYRILVGTVSDSFHMIAAFDLMRTRARN
jgi:hypothetical protein